MPADTPPSDDRVSVTTPLQHDPHAPLHPQNGVSHTKNPMQMPLSESDAAEEIAEVGVEGVPADPKSGPGKLWSQLAIAGSTFVLVAIGIGLWIGWPAAAAALGFFALAWIFNPVFRATEQRAHDRQVIVQRHDPLVPQEAGSDANVGGPPKPIPDTRS